ncbi:MAG: phage/plasmid primase, P4 family [Veillonellales bacterium]
MNDTASQNLIVDEVSPEVLKKFAFKMAEENRMDELNAIFQYADHGSVQAIRKEGNPIKPIMRLENLGESLMIANEKVRTDKTVVSKGILKTLISFMDCCPKVKEKNIFAQPETTPVDKTSEGECSPTILQPNCQSIEMQNRNGMNVDQRLSLVKSQEALLVSQKAGEVIPKEKPNPIEVANKLMRRYNFALYKESVYLFTHSYYRLYSKVEICRLINETCRQDVYVSGHSSFLNEVYSFIYHELSIVKYDKSFEEIAHLVAFRNGYLNIRDGLFYSPDPKYFFTHCIDVDYVPNDRSDCPNFRNFLRFISDGDVLLENRLWEIMGYIFSNDVSTKAFFIFQGFPDTGKSILGEFISSFFPEEARTAVSMDEFENNFALGNLQGKAICLDLDLSSGKISDKVAGRLKRLTGNDLITADVKYQERVKFHNRAKLLYGTNHRFETVTDDSGLQNRLVVVPFTNSVPKPSQDHNLLSLFVPEKLAIVKEALWHYCQLVANKYAFSGHYEINERGVINSCNEDAGLRVEGITLIRQFLTTCCVMTSQTEFSFTIDLYNAFVQYYANEPIKLMDLKQFSEILNSNYGQYVTKKRKRRTPKSNPESVFYGIKLNEGGM